MSAPCEASLVAPEIAPGSELAGSRVRLPEIRSGMGEEPLRVVRSTCRQGLGYVVNRADVSRSRRSGLGWARALLAMDARRFLGAVVLAGFLIRLAVVLCVFRTVAAPTFDHNEFGWEMGWTARSIVLGRGFSSPFLPVTGPTALMPPLFPYLLAGVERVFGLYTAASAAAILSLNSLLSALTAVPIFFLTRKVVSEKAARMAVLLWTVYPYGVYFSADRVWDYALTALLLSLCLWLGSSLGVRRAGAWAAFGLLCGVAALSNPSVLTVLGITGLVAVGKLAAAGQAWGKRAACALLAGLSVCAPWAIRNTRVFHQPTFLRDGFWLEFWAGNNGDTFTSNAAWAHPASNPAEMARYEAMPEPEYMAEKKAMGIGFVKRHPMFFLAVSARRALSFWTAYWSLDRRYLAQEPTEIPDVLFCTGMTLLVWRGARRWWRRDRGGALPYVLGLMVFPVTYYVTHSSPDYRQPIEPILVMLAGVGFAGDPGEDEATVDEAMAEEELLAAV